MLDGTDGPTIRTNLNLLPTKRYIPPIKEIWSIDGLNSNLKRWNAHHNPSMKVPLLGMAHCFAIDNKLAIHMHSQVGVLPSSITLELY